MKTYVQRAAGNINANTSLTDTVFYFDVAPAFLKNTLDRFASIFVDPLFPKDKVERELDTMNLEFEATFINDEHRCERVRKQVGNPKHVYAKFELGNKTTLTNDDKLLTDVITFYKEHYSANVMGLAVLGKEPLDLMEKFVVQMFNRIVNKSLTSPLHTSHPYSNEYCRKLVKIVPYQDVRRLILFFPLPYTMTSNVSHMK